MGFVQAAGFDRLEQVVKSVVLEGLDSILVVGGDKHHFRHGIRIEHAEHLYPGDLWHLDIEEDDVGLKGIDLFQSLNGIAGLADDLDLTGFIQ